MTRSPARWRWPGARAATIVDAVRWACAAGAACVRTVGAYPSLPTRAEIDELYTTTGRPAP